MQKKTYIIGIGSNHNPEYNITEAKKILKLRFSDIIFSEEKETAGVESGKGYNYLNLAARFSTCIEPPMVNQVLKGIETILGREKKSKQVCIDIDLLSCNGINLCKDIDKYPFWKEIIAEISNE